MADGKENKLVTTVKSIPSNVKKDVKAASTTTKVLVGVVGVLTTVGAFALGRATKKAPKAAKVTPKAAN
jgi:hypothetical protein